MPPIRHWTILVVPMGKHTHPLDALPGHHGDILGGFATGKETQHLLMTAFNVFLGVVIPPCKLFPYSMRLDCESFSHLSITQRHLV